jgi:uncharacterized heparinase superfamily protein
MLGPLTFRFLNETRTLEPGHWRQADAAHLWRYNLHYFDDLNAADSVGRNRWHRHAIEDWIRAVPVGAPDAWDPYPLSLRVVNWIKWFISNAAKPEWLQSLANQVRALESRLEYHLGGNHLFSNAKALFFAGLFFEGSEADRWLRRGQTLICKEIRRQVLSDGGQYERSPMYHSLALEDLLDLINIARRYQPNINRPVDVDGWKSTAQQMAAWLDTMCHPDGDIAFFNDAAFSIAPHPAELRRYASELIQGFEAKELEPVVRMEASGYIRVAVGDAVSFLDVGEIGPDELPGHAHADTLSFEMSLFGHRVFVNSGTSTYEAGVDRRRERGTAAHNTVTLNEADSSEMWASFRVARRARPLGITLSDADGDIAVEAAHDGYRRFSGVPVHFRRWRFGTSRFSVEDEIKGTYEQGVARFHLQPEVRLKIDDTQRGGLLVLPNGREVRWCASVGAAIRNSVYAPEFGRRVENICIELPVAKCGVRFDLAW